MEQCNAKDDKEEGEDEPSLEAAPERHQDAVNEHSHARHVRHRAKRPQRAEHAQRADVHEAEGANLMKIKKKIFHKIIMIKKVLKKFC